GRRTLDLGPFVWHHGSRRGDSNVMRRRATNTSSTTPAEIASAQFRARPRSSSAAGPADAIRPRIPAAHTKEVAMLIGVKTRGETPADAQATGIAIRSPGRNRQDAASGIA